ncbi:MAG: 50S ribosomal protein L1 [Chromatiales bacterium]|nr:50S ribosomal protein L1 [Chromatiales bacterium]
MARLSKRKKMITEQCSAQTLYPLADAFELLKKCSTVKFDESVEVSIRLGIDARKSDQLVRGVTTLPHGLGKQIKVAVFTQGEQIAKAEAVGADAVGLDDLIDKAKQGDFDYDAVVASPDVMPKVGSIGQILGPRGLMPNPKDGTVSADVAEAVRNIKAGQAKYRADKAGILHCSIGKLTFTSQQLADNFNTLLSDVIKAKPSSAKGLYLKKISVSSTMGPGLTVDPSSLSV